MLDTLRSIVPPPAKVQPVSYPHETLAALSKEYYRGEQIVYPADFWEMCTVYGPGIFEVMSGDSWRKRIFLLHPASNNFARDIANIAEYFPTYEERTIFPIIWDSDGSLIFYENTHDDSSVRAIFLSPSRSGDFVEVHCAISDYL